MIIVAASKKTTKILPRLFCKKWKHVSPIIVKRKQLTLYQFTHPYRCATPIQLQWRDIRILKRHGWIFIPVANTPKNIDIRRLRTITCVDFTKRIIGIKDFRIQTPNRLIKRLKS